MKVEWNGKKLTKKRALFLCWKLWEWLGENPDMEKWDWPHWEVNDGKVLKMENDCPCCEIAFYRLDCVGCPLQGYWSKIVDTSCRCENSDSPYRKYKEVSLKGKAKYARRIAAAAKRRYEKL